jgi:hypothetical protein
VALLMTTLRDTLSVDGGEMSLVTVQPPGDPTTRHPALVVVPSIFGVADDLVAQVSVLGLPDAVALRW